MHKKNDPIGLGDNLDTEPYWGVTKHADSGMGQRLSSHNLLLKFSTLNFQTVKECFMKAEIHPEYHKIKATCSCGNVVEIGSTLASDIHLDVCSSCHPFYTGKQKTIDSGGRVERFRKRFGTRTSAGS